MRKAIAPLFILIAVIIAGTIGVILTKVSNKTDDQVPDNQSTDIFENQTDLCVSINKETVSSLLTKPVIRTESLTRNTLQSCQYYLNDTQALVLNHDYTPVVSKIKGHEFLERKVTSNSSISMKNHIIVQKDGLINEIYLVFNDNEFISINRPNAKTINEEEIVDFAVKLSDFLQKKELNVIKENKENVLLQQEEDIIKKFFKLIDEKNITGAISMMSKEMTGDETKEQAWGVQFNDIKSINVLKSEPWKQEKWNNTDHTYKVTLEAYVSSDAKNVPIPYYGWEDNPNIRWVKLVKENDQWKINSLSTGP